MLAASGCAFQNGSRVFILISNTWCTVKNVQIWISPTFIGSRQGSDVPIPHMVVRCLHGSPNARFGDPAAILLKLGYGFVCIAIPIPPSAARSKYCISRSRWSASSTAHWLSGTTDMKRLIAFSSVAHGFCHAWHFHADKFWVNALSMEWLPTA